MSEQSNIAEYAETMAQSFRDAGLPVARIEDGGEGEPKTAFLKDGSSFTGPDYLDLARKICEMLGSTPVDDERV